jgi:hypothetical protein
MRKHPRRAEVDPQSPRGWATSDRNGHVSNLYKMKFQFEWRGSRLMNTRTLVSEDELDIPQRQLGTPALLGPDPPPLINARPEQYSMDEQPVSTRYTLNPATGLAQSIRIIMPVNGHPLSNRIVTTPGNTTP